MTLHEAIKQLLIQRGRSMTTTEIAHELNKNKSYSKQNGSEIDDFQIHGRTRKYPNLFDRNGSLVSLKGTIQILNVEKKKTFIPPLNQRSFVDTDVIENILLKEKAFKTAEEIDEIVPNRPGIYCIKIKNPALMPSTFRGTLELREHNILYVGIATKSLQKRLMGQELRAKGHGTFFRSLGAILGYKPETGSLINKANKKNYKFKLSDEQKIIQWINRNLLVNWIEFKGDISAYETELIKKILPIINIAKNPMALNELKALRAECVKIANQ